MKRKVTTWILALVVAAGTAGMTARAQINGNGGFYVPYIAQGFWYYENSKHVYIDVLVDCNTGYTCGLTNIEIDWDDGSEIDTLVDYLPIWEEEFRHEYGSNGTYHPFVSGDDDQGNWFNTTKTFYIND